MIKKFFYVVWVLFIVAIGVGGFESSANPTITQDKSPQNSSK